MIQDNIYIKLAYVPGLQDIVLDEIKEHKDFKIIKTIPSCFFIEYIESFEQIKNLKTISRVYLVTKDKVYNPIYLTKHKSILGQLIEIILDQNPPKTFKTFSISCAGSNSSEIREIKRYISSEFKLDSKDEADLKIHIAKIDDEWEVGVQITPRPLSVRNYRIQNMSGALDSTIAHTINTLCDLENHSSYLNIFSGSGTLLIEAGLEYKNLNKLVGFDNNKEHLSLSIQNIKKAGLIKKVEVKYFDITENPDLGTFDVITSDLPFGMVISKDGNLEALYTNFIQYCDNHLNHDGVVAVYTSQFKLFEKIVEQSSFKIKKELKVDLITNEGQYLSTKIFILKKKHD